MDFLYHLGIVTSTGRPERGSSSVLLRPFLNSETHCFIVEYDGEESFSVESISCLISSGVKPFK